MICSPGPTCSTAAMWTQTYWCGAQTPHQIELIGPLFGSYSRQWREGKGDNLQAFVIDWQAGRRAVPKVIASIHWRPGHDVSGDPIIRIRFDGVSPPRVPLRSSTAAGHPQPRAVVSRFVEDIDHHQEGLWLRGR